MQIKTVWNRVHKIKGFVYEQVRWVEDGMEVTVRPRKGSRGVCSSCGRVGSTYDTLAARRFTFVPLWGIGVFLVYAMRRVDCPKCGVKVEQVPWAIGKRHLTVAYAVFLSRWGKRLSWQAVAEIFQTRWETVFRSVAWVVAYGLKHRELSGITAVGMDEVQYQRGHRYLTVVYQLDRGCRRLLWVGQDRTVRPLLQFFRWLGRERTASVRDVCSDMWKPYLKVLKKKLPQAIHILDRFHLVARLNKAIDAIRAEEAKRLKRQGYEPVLTHSRWCFLKNRQRLTGRQRVKLNELMTYDLKSVRAYLLKESFQGLWNYTSPFWAGRYLDAWLSRAMRSRLDPIKIVAKGFRKHRLLILNWFRAKKQFSCGIVEGLNYKIKLTFKTSYGFRTFNAAQIAIYHTLGQLPEPHLTHRFC